MEREEKWAPGMMLPPTFRQRLAFAGLLLAGRIKPEQPNATIHLRTGMMLRAYVSGHGTDLETGESETFYVMADEDQFSIVSRTAREHALPDRHIERVEYDDGNVEAHPSGFDAPLAPVDRVNRKETDGA